MSNKCEYTWLWKVPGEVEEKGSVLRKVGVKKVGKEGTMRP